VSPNIQHKYYVVSNSNTQADQSQRGAIGLMPELSTYTTQQLLMTIYSAVMALMRQASEVVWRRLLAVSAGTSLHF
jgi:hypothetical protein